MNVVYDEGNSPDSMDTSFSESLAAKPLKLFL